MFYVFYKFCYGKNAQALYIFFVNSFKINLANQRRGEIEMRGKEIALFL